MAQHMFQSVQDWSDVADHLGPRLGFGAARAVPQEDGSLAVTVPNEIDADVAAALADLAALRRKRLAAYAADRRWRREVAGITVAGVGVATDTASQIKISGAAQAAAAGLLPATVKFKSVAGFVDVSPSQISAIYAALVAHIQAGYAAEAAVADAIAAGTITTSAAIDAAFAGL